PDTGRPAYAARRGRRALQPSTDYTCSAKPGAEREPHKLQFWNNQAPVDRIELRKATQILRAGNPATSNSRASPGDPQGELARRAKRRWPGPLVSFPSLGKKLAARRRRNPLRKTTETARPGGRALQERTKPSGTAGASPRPTELRKDEPGDEIPRTSQSLRTIHKTTIKCGKKKENPHVQTKPVPADGGPSVHHHCGGAAAPAR